MANPSAQRQFLVKVSGFPGYFMTKSGGNISSDTTKVYDGGALTPDVIASPPEAEDVTVSRAYDVKRDGDILVRLRQQIGRFRTTVSVTPTDADLVATGAATVYPNALLIGLNEPEYDSSGGDAATFELVWAICSYR